MMMRLEFFTIVFGSAGFIMLILMYPVSFSWEFGSICLFIFGIVIRLICSLVGSFAIVVSLYYLANKFDKWYYTPEKNKSRILKTLTIPLVGQNDIKFLTKEGTIIAIGYRKILFNEYSAFVEFSSDQLERENIRFKWKGEWLESKDKSKIHIINSVNINNSTPEMFYAFLNDLYTQDRKSFY